MGDLLGGKYEIVRPLGEGGMGVVYEAVHAGTGRRVALKVIVSAALARDADVLTRFKREARTSGKIDSQHVVQVLDAGVDTTNGSPYLVMELLNGEDVAELVRRLGPMPSELVLRIVAQACTGLESAHTIGVVHRDIKSANMFLTRSSGSQRVVKLLDFGIAKVRANHLAQSDNHGLTRTGALLGSPLYMSPEQARGVKTIDGRSDIFSLGVMMYEALCGVPPYASCESLGESILAICSRPPPPLQDRAPWVSAEVAAITHKALALDPAGRYQSAAAMREDVLRLCGADSISESMLESLSPSVRSRVATRYVQGSPDSNVSLPDMLDKTTPMPVPPGSSPVLLAAAHSPPASIPEDLTGRPTGVVTASDVGKNAAADPATRGRWLLAGGIGVVVAVAVGGYALRKDDGGRPASASTASATTSVSIAERPPIVPASTVVASSEGLRRVELNVIASRDAKVDVDGAEVDVVDGKVNFTGELGTVHHVRVRSGAREATVDVVIAQSGAMPPRIELADRSAVVNGAMRRPAASVKPLTSAIPSSQPVEHSAEQPEPKPPVATSSDKRSLDRTSPW